MALNVVIIGAGRMGREHAAAATAAGDNVIAVLDPDIARAGALAGEHGAVAATAVALGDTLDALAHGDGDGDMAVIVRVSVSLPPRSRSCGHRSWCERPRGETSVGAGTGPGSAPVGRVQQLCTHHGGDDYPVLSRGPGPAARRTVGSARLRHVGLGFWWLLAWPATPVCRHGISSPVSAEAGF